MRENKIKKYGSERNYMLQYRYGITEDDFQRMLAQQGGLCAICRDVEATHVDHCHDTGQVRGLLCFNCNNALGHFRDCVATMTLAALYLEGYDYWPDFVVLPKQRSRSTARTRTYHLTRRYRLREEDVERMIEDQLGLCAVCWSNPPEHVDHCHESGLVRKALCLPCNSGIGQFRDDARNAWQAVSYVEGPPREELELSEEELVRAADEELVRVLDHLSEATMV
ncbi:endonuclease domain-containing protein [Thermoactinospora rubra]|uniref:endonuclease domain-containing protein n=1 Tax=Thermoactinospora rubra TaxID=1088767 RepID=UPI001301C042|nr:endonuclease domain-containing protein [Thermoactinospora rubra]